MTLIDMQTMRYINLLDRVAHVQTRKCFMYNNTIIFAVPRGVMSRAIGPQARTIKTLQETLGKRVRIIAEASDEKQVADFVKSIIEPAGFKSIEIIDGEFVINAGSQYKAALIGRNRVRLEELDLILKNTFGKSVKII